MRSCARRVLITTSLLKRPMTIETNGVQTSSTSAKNQSIEIM